MMMVVLRASDILPWTLRNLVRHLLLEWGIFDDNRFKLFNFALT